MFWRVLNCQSFSPSPTNSHSLYWLPLSENVESNHFPNHLSGLLVSVRGGGGSVKINSFNMSVTVPFLTTTHLDFTGLNNIIAYATASLEALMIHLDCMLVSVVTVMSSINPLLDGIHISVCLPP